MPPIGRWHNKSRESMRRSSFLGLIDRMHCIQMRSFPTHVARSVISVSVFYWAQGWAVQNGWAFVRIGSWVWPDYFSENWLRIYSLRVYVINTTKSFVYTAFSLPQQRPIHSVCIVHHYEHLYSPKHRQYKDTQRQMYTTSITRQHNFQKYTRHSWWHQI